MYGIYTIRGTKWHCANNDSSVSIQASLTYRLAIVQQTGSPVSNIEQNTVPLTKHHLANIDLLCLDVLMYCSDRLTSLFFFLKLCSENLN